MSLYFYTIRKVVLFFVFVFPKFIQVRTKNEVYDLNTYFKIIFMVISLIILLFLAMKFEMR